MADLLLDIEVAVPLGLLLNEVLTNAFKYAYTDMAARGPESPTQVSSRASKNPVAHDPASRTSLRPSLLVRIQPEPAGGLLVEVQDNGPGLSPQASTGRSKSFGQRLIRELTGQLGGEMSLTNRQGTYFRLWIPARA